MRSHTGLHKYIIYKVNFKLVLEICKLLSLQSDYLNSLEFWKAWLSAGLISDVILSQRVIFSRLVSSNSEEYTLGSLEQWGLHSAYGFAHTGLHTSKSGTDEVTRKSSFLGDMKNEGWPTRPIRDSRELSWVSHDPGTIKPGIPLQFACFLAI